VVNLVFFACSANGKKKINRRGTEAQRKTYVEGVPKQRGFAWNVIVTVLIM